MNDSKTSKRLLPLLALLGFLIPAARLFAKGAPTGVETKIALEESLERRLKSVVSQILGTNDVIIIVNVELSAQEEKKGGDTSADKSLTLPGVPMKEKIGERDAVPAFSADDTLTQIKRLSATLVLDKGVSESDANIVKNVTTGLLGVKPDRGDTLVIQRMDFHREQMDALTLQKLLAPPDLWWTVGLAISLLALFLLTVFLFGSFRSFLGEFVKVLRSQADAAQEQAKVARSPKAGEAEETGPALDLGKDARGAALANGALSENGKNGSPFSFLHEADLRNLIFLLKNEGPDQVAIIVNYLSPAMANDVMASLDTARRSEVLQRLSAVTDVDPDVVKAVEEKIREKIAYVVGGEDRVQGLLDYAEPAAQQAMLAALAQKNAPLAASLKKRLFTLEDMANLDGAVLAAIVRRVNVRSLAAVLKQTAGETQEKVLTKLPAGSAAILREEIGLARVLPPQRFSQERRRVLDTLRRMQEEGLLTAREGK